MSRLLYLVTDPITADCFLRGQLKHLQGLGYDVHLAASPGALLDAVGAATGAVVHPISMAREIRLGSDVRALLALRRLVRRLRPQLVHASTPKAGLLGLLAARWARVTHRIYLVRGLRLETLTGPRRWLLSQAERAAAAAATRVVCVSDSLRRRYEARRLAPGHVVAVFGAGSSTGVSLERFAGARASGARESARQRLGIPLQAPVLGFVGRLTRDKGIADLVAAFLDTVLR